MKDLITKLLLICLFFLSTIASDEVASGNDPTVAADATNATCIQNNTRSSLTTLLNEIDALEELIELQTRKLDLLKQARHRVLAGETLPTSYVPRHASPTPMRHAESSTTLIPPSVPPVASAQLLPISQIELNHTVLWSSIVTLKLPKRGERVLVSSVSAAGELTLRDRKTMKFASATIFTNLTSITASAFDGIAEGLGNMVLCSEEGEVVILTLRPQPRQHAAGEKPAVPSVIAVEIVTRFFLPALDDKTMPQQVFNEASLRNSEYAVSNSISAPLGAPYGTTANIYHGGSTRGVSVYVGDSMGRLLQYHLNGTLSQWLAVDHFRPLRYMSRIGQVLTIPVGNTVLLYHIVKLGVRPRVCLGGTEDFTEVVVDTRSLTHAIAVGTSGALYSFNTKFHEGGETICKLSQIVPATATGTLRLHEHGRNLVSLRGYIIAAPSGACDVTVYDSSRLRYQRDGLVAAAVERPCDVSTHHILSIDATPAAYIDAERRMPKEFTVLVTLLDSNSSKLIVYDTSLPEVAEDINELAWLKLPMLGVAITAFLVYKYFAMNKKEKKLTPHLDKYLYQKPGTSPSGGSRHSTGGATSSSGLESERLREEIDRLTARAKQMSGKFQ